MGKGTGASDIGPGDKTRLPDPDGESTKSLETRGSGFEYPANEMVVPGAVEIVGAAPSESVAIETDVAVIVTPEPNKIELPATNWICGALIVRLSSVRAPVADKRMLKASDSMPPFNEKSPTQVSDSGPLRFDDSVPEQIVLCTVSTVAAIAAEDKRVTATKNGSERSITNPIGSLGLE